MTKDREPGEVLAEIRALPEDARLLLQLAAILYEPVSTTFLCRAFLSLDHFFSGDRRPRYDEAHSLIAGLKEEGLLSADNQCEPGLAELLVRESIREKRFARLAAFVEQATPAECRHSRPQTRCWRALRRFRIGLYSGDGALVEEALETLEPAGHGDCAALFGGVPPVTRILTSAFDPAWFANLPVFLQFSLLNHVVEGNLATLSASPALERYLEFEAPARLSPEERLPFARLLAKLHIVRGRADELSRLEEENRELFAGSGLRGAAAFLRGDAEAARTFFQEDLDHLGRVLGAAEASLLGLPGFFHTVLSLRRSADDAGADAAELALARERLARMVARLRALGEGTGAAPELLPLECLAALAARLAGESPNLLPLGSALGGETHKIALLLALIVFHWLGVAIAPEFAARLENIREEAGAAGYGWIAAEAAGLAAALAGAPPPPSATLTRLFRPAADWRHSLSELIEAVHEARQADPDRRLAWFVHYDEGALSLLPKEQRKNAQGGWSAGRVLSLPRLAAEDQPWFSPQDRELRAALVPAPDGGVPAFDPQKALPALIGHPLVYLRESPKTHVEVVSGEPELMVERRGESLFLHFAEPLSDAEYSVRPETPTRFKVLRIRPEHRKAAEAIGPLGLEAPLAASDEVLAAIGPLSACMVVHSAIDLPGAASPATEVEGDPTPHLHIIPVGSGFRLELFVRPFGDRGPWLKPGVGAANLIADIGGSRLRARRDLEAEEARAREVEESCPMLDLATDMEVEHRHEWRLGAPEDCLEVLLELDAIRDRVALDWPEGEKLSIRRRVGAGSLNLNIRGVRQDWFALSGKVQVDEDTVVELRYLLEQARRGGPGGRFIPLGEGRFLALTQEFKNRLDELAHYGALESSGELRVHALAALALEDLAAEAQVTVDAAWQARRAALAAVEREQPQPPRTLKAELRDYQREGFAWMARLAALGFGACLADDMGLGKTVQAISLILSRAKDGPTLVVAPTSVCMNWQAELRRFAPSLAPRLLAEEGRGEDFAPGPFAVVVASYTLLQQEADLLAGVNWQTIVLDEAQAIKNATTKRSRAAMRLSGGFKLITTGTPIENHLGELWNLFAFINPGLLGSCKQFNRRFGIPIEKHRDRAAARMLKKLIRPFTLRRIKSDVLDELPPRTEVSLRVELGPEERAFYEALRREALENIESGGAGDTGERQMRILAEIMRLRRACCNPRLVDESLNLSSSKEQVFAELVEELTAGGHKALVFSQFTGHLAFLRRLLDGRGVGYCYLDGSTPAARRREQVEAFQAGEAALFLISLKAGGLGLNLTAADYVIHMDPWWNPAVEDQASDRAHRIGQKRPVTVYRLVTADTIEEKIVRLHQEKRDLAHSLLEGADACARIDIDELLELIRGD